MPENAKPRSWRDRYHPFPEANETARAAAETHWHARGYLPHCEDWRRLQTVTFRLADAVPIHVAERLAAEDRTQPGDAAYRQRIEQYLDDGHGECLLRRAEIASLVKDSLAYFEGERYRQHAWTIMPNHVHAVVEPLRPHTLSSILEGWKSVTARQINRFLGRSGVLWQEEYWDRYVRNEEHYRNAVNYILRNPVKAGLAARPEDWPWTWVLTPQPQ